MTRASGRRFGTVRCVQRASFSWDRLTVTCVLSFCVLVAGLSVGLVLGELRDEFGLSGVVAAAHGASFGVSLIIMGLVGLRLVARIGRPTAFWGSVAFATAGVLLLCIGRSAVVTLTATAISGAACALLVLLMPGIVADHHGEGRAGAFAAINGFPGLAGISFALVVGAVMSSGHSWRWPYAILTIAFASAFAIAGRGVRIPTSTAVAVPVLPLFHRAEVRGPWIRIVHAVMVEFPVGIWAVVYLKEVGGASSGLAAICGGLWGLCLFVSRMLLPRYVARFGAWSSSVAFAITALGAVVMWAGPGFGGRILGLTIVAMGCGPLYPLAVDGLYRQADVDSVSLGAVTALASGISVTVGPMALGLLADQVGLRSALLFVPVLAIVGIYTSRPSPGRLTDAGGGVQRLDPAGQKSAFAGAPDR
jgi:MFS family permease